VFGGVKLDIRSIDLNMNRNQFSLNPTSCEPKQVTGQVISTLGNVANLTNRFQVGACGALAFKPSLKLSLKGATKRAGNPALRAVITYPKGDNANIAKTQVTLPHSAFLEQSHIRTVCTRVQFAVDACPKGSIYGSARAVSPLLDQPLEGPVYLRSSSNKLPDLVVDLKGQIEVVLDGKVDTGKEDGLRTTFQSVPDAPVSKFILNLDGGKKGLIVNSENLCSPKAKVKAVSNLTAQNGKTYDTQPRVANSCGKKAKKKGLKR
jgi:hypothetical protein